MRQTRTAALTGARAARRRRSMRRACSCWRSTTSSCATCSTSSAPGAAWTSAPPSAPASTCPTPSRRGRASRRPLPRSVRRSGRACLHGCPPLAAWTASCKPICHMWEPDTQASLSSAATCLSAASGRGRREAASTRAARAGGVQHRAPAMPRSGPALHQAACMRAAVAAGVLRGGAGGLSTLPYSPLKPTLPLHQAACAHVRGRCRWRAARRCWR